MGRDILLYQKRKGRKTLIFLRLKTGLDVDVMSTQQNKWEQYQSIKWSLLIYSFVIYVKMRSKGSKIRKNNMVQL